MILVALLLAAFVINLDTTIVNVALPALVRELHATTTQLQWVVDAYNLVFAALLLTFGSLSDRFGRKGMLLAGLDRVRRGQPGRRLHHQPGPADRGAGRDGARRRHDLPGHPLADLQRLHRTTGTGPRHRPVGRHRRGGDRARPHRRRLAARALQLDQHLRGHGPGGGGRHRAGRGQRARRRRTRSGRGWTSPAWCCRRRPWRCWSSPSSRRRTTAGAARAASPGSRPRRCCWPPSSAGSGGRQPPDARRPAVPQHAVQRGQRRGDRGVLHAVRLHLPDDAVLPVRPGLRAAVHRRAPAAGGAVGRRRLGGRDPARGAVRHQARSSPSGWSPWRPSTAGRPRPPARPSATASSRSRWCCTGWAWA